MLRMAKYFITFTPKCFALTMAVINAELRAILLNKMLQNFTISVALCEFCARCPMHKILNERILASLVAVYRYKSVLGPVSPTPVSD